MRPAAAEDGDTDGEEGHGDDDARPGGVQGQPRGHVRAGITLEAEITIRQLAMMIFYANK